MRRERRELVREGLHARLERDRAFADLSGARGRLGEPLVRERQRDVVGDAPGEHHIRLVIEAGRERQKAEHGGELAVDVDGDDKGGAEPLVVGRRPAKRGFRLDVRKDPEAPVRVEQLSQGRNDRDARRDVTVRECAREGVGDHRLAIRAQHRESEAIMGQHALGDRGDASEHVANVEDAGQGRQKLVGDRQSLQLLEIHATAG